ncbi:hypothetical protein AB0K18_05505 [Nonomuraea sp. NPDC049421]|uniref:hypothetical protein n=1 Tax=Nonomuraea sp. NPDC049421 TaxID=3155275 RepID=UPI00342426F1
MAKTITHATVSLEDGVTYTCVVDDIDQAVESGKQAAGNKRVSPLGGSISRQCLALGLVDEVQLHIVPILPGEGGLAVRRTLKARRPRTRRDVRIRRRDAPSPPRPFSNVT